MRKKQYLLIIVLLFFCSTPFIFANPLETVESAFATYRNFLTGEAVQSTPSKFIVVDPSIKTMPPKSSPLPQPLAEPVLFSVVPNVFDNALPRDVFLNGDFSFPAQVLVGNVPYPAQFMTFVDASTIVLHVPQGARPGVYPLAIQDLNGISNVLQIKVLQATTVVPLPQPPVTIEPTPLPPIQPQPRPSPVPPIQQPDVKKLPPRTQPCILQSARWSHASRVEGQTVTLTATGTASCAGKIAYFTIKEKDIVGDDEITELAAIFNTEGIASILWKTIFVPDGFFEVGKPDAEFYFKSSLETQQFTGRALTPLTGQATAAKIRNDIFGITTSLDDEEDFGRTPTWIPEQSSTENSVTSNILIVTPSSGKPSVEPVVGERIGFNVGKIFDWNANVMFTNLRMHARTFFPTPMPRDRDGWPLQAPAQSYLFKGITNYPVGPYIVIAQGDGDVAFSGDMVGAISVTGSTKKITLPVTPTNYGIDISITRTNPANPVKFDIVPQQYENTYTTTDVFYPPFLNTLTGIDTLRFMDALGINDDQDSDWNKRTLRTAYTQGDASFGGTEPGIAYEYIFDLTDVLQQRTGNIVHVWLNIPHKADDNYIQQLAQLINQRLQPGQKLYVEYSNELWNGGFGQKADTEQLAVQAGLLSTVGWPGSVYYQAYRLAQIMDIFVLIFGAKSSQLIPLAATQSGNTGVIDAFFVIWDNPQYNPQQHQIGAVATNPYCCHTIADDIYNNNEVSTITVPQIIARAQATVPLVGQNAAADLATAQRYGVSTLVAYEGGQHLVATGAGRNDPTLTEKLTAANRDPAMQQLIDQIFDEWYNNGGDLFNFYNHIEGYSQFGSWGALEYTEQDPTTAPKYLAIQERIGSSGGGSVFDFTLATVPASGSVVQGQNVQTTVTATYLSGTAQPVMFSALNVPSGVVATFNPTACIPQIGQPCSTQLMFQTTTATPLVTNHQVTIQATAGNVQNTDVYLLTITSDTQPLPKPRLDQLAPSTVTAGTQTTVSLIGDYFTPASQVIMDNMYPPAYPAYPSTFVNQQQIDIDIPAVAPIGAYSFVVFDVTGSSQPQILTVIPPVQQQKPVIAQLQPAITAGNEAIAILGNNFDQGAKVFANAQEYSYAQWQSAVQIDMWVPQGTPSGSYTIEIENEDGQRSDPATLTVSSPGSGGGNSLRNSEVSFDFRITGSTVVLDQIVNLKTGKTFPTMQADLLSFVLRDKNGQKTTYSLGSLPSTLTVGGFSVPGTQTLQLDWQDVTIDPQNTMDVTALIRLDDNSPTAEFTLNIQTTMPDYSLYTVTYPIAEFQELSSTDREALVVPHYMGLLVLDPHKNYQLRSLGVTNAQDRAMQFLAYYNLNTEDMIYFAVKDTQGYYKHHTFDVKQDRIELSVTHFPENHLTPDIEYLTPYPVVLGALEGDWYDAAQYYRQWAVQNMVPRGKLETTTQISPFFDYLASYGTFNLGVSSTNRKNAVNLVSEIDAYKSFLNTCPDPDMPNYVCDPQYVIRNMLIELYSWSGNPIGQSIANWPANYKPIESAIFETVKQLHQKENIVIPYTIQIDFDTNTPQYQSEPVAVNSLVDENGQLVTSRTQVTTWVTPDPATKWWQDYTKDIMLDHADFSDDDQNYNDIGFDGAYWDVLSGKIPELDYSINRGHAQGGGNYWIQGEKTRLQKSRAATNVISPQWTMVSEHATEFYANELEFVQWNGPSQNKDPLYNIPLFSTVYHDYVGATTILSTHADITRLFGPQAIPFTKYLQGLYIAHGLIPTISNDISIGFTFPLQQQDKPLFLLVKQIHRSYNYAKKYLLYGQMLRPLETTGASTQTPVVSGGQAGNIFYKNYYPNVPYVISSVWKASDNSLGIVLINWDSVDQPVGFTFDYAKYGLMPGQTYYLLQLDELGANQLQSYTNTFSHSITVPAGSIIILSVTSLDPSKDIDADGVDDTQDQCMNTATTYRSRMTFNGCPLPQASKFSPSLSRLPNRQTNDIFAFNNFAIGIYNKGKIEFSSQPVSLINRVMSGNAVVGYDPLDLDTYVNIDANSISIDSQNLPTLNLPADITLYNIFLTNPVIYNDGVLCTACSIKSYDPTIGDIVFTVPGFSTYSAQEGSCGDNYCSVGESCGTCAGDCGQCTGGGSPGSGSRGGGGGSQTLMIDLDRNAIYTFSLPKSGGQALILYLNNQHSLTTKQNTAVNGNVIFTTSPLRNIFDLAEGQTVSVNIDKEPTDDFTITYVQDTGNFIDVRIERLAKAPKEPSQDTRKPGTVRADDGQIFDTSSPESPQEQPLLSFVIRVAIVLGILVLTLGFSFVIKYRRKKRAIE